MNTFVDALQSGLGGTFGGFRTPIFFVTAPPERVPPDAPQKPSEHPRRGDGSSDKYRKEAIAARKPTNYLCQPKQKTKR